MDFSKDLSIIILAAGKGKRMKSDIPKVLHEICFRPVLYYILKEVHELNPKNIFLIAGFKGALVAKYAKDNFPGIEVIFQDKQLGTAHAVSVASPYISRMGKNCLVIAGDMPLITSKSLSDLISFKYASQSSAVLSTALLENPYGYGRVVKDSDDNILRIVEEADANKKEKEIKQVNNSIYCFDTMLLFKYLKEICPDNSQSEFYLTDIIEKFASGNYKIKPLPLKQNWQAEGFNDRAQLAKIQKIMQSNINENHMISGVTIRDSSSAFIDPAAKIGRDTVVEPFSIIKGDSLIESSCIIGPFVQIENCSIGKSAHIYNCTIKNASIGDNESVGPSDFKVFSKKNFSGSEVN